MLPFTETQAPCPKCQGPMVVDPGGAGVLCRRCAFMNLIGDDDEVEEEDDVRSEQDYEIHQRIGRGGAGNIYLAEDRRLGRQVALKMLNIIGSGHDGAVRRFHSEIEAIAELDHPHIVPVYNKGEIDGRPFFTMKFIAGGSLDQQPVDTHDPRPAVALLVKVAHAVHHAHERGILHRDLKPSNILVDDEGEPYVSDFGLAKRQDTSIDLTRSGSVLGTPGYMSPEQASGESHKITITSDVFSLGTIFYQRLTGHEAFSGETAHIVLKNVIDSEVRFPSESEGVDPDLSNICLKCLDKTPDRRYPTALAFAQDLERWQRGEPVIARPITPPPPPPPPRACLALVSAQPSPCRRGRLRQPRRDRRPNG